MTHVSLISVDAPGSEPERIRLYNAIKSQLPKGWGVVLTGTPVTSAVVVDLRAD